MKREENKTSKTLQIPCIFCTTKETPKSNTDYMERGITKHSTIDFTVIELKSNLLRSDWF